MLFNSLLYLLIFLPVIILISFYLRDRIFIAKCIIIFSSIIFYSYFNISHLPIIIISIFINYFLSIIFIKNIRPKKFYLILGITINILILGYYKYQNFLIIIINSTIDLNIPLSEMQFPLALSFITFQQIAYLVDIYNSNTKKPKNLIDYSMFVIFFPQLIAGPIVRFSEFAKQLKNNFLKINYDSFCLGLVLISIGIFKKSFISDNLSILVDSNFNNIMNLNIFEAWVTSYAWSFQFYFDFSGYVDLALGSALLLSIKLPINFNSPFKAVNVIDFWQRWHITLTRFLTNYVYYPLSKIFLELTFFKSLIIILIVFFISGIWHGPNYTFILFGLINGFGVCFNYLKKKYFNIHINKFVSIFLTFNFINISFIFFRSNSINDGLIIIKKMLSFKDVFGTTKLILHNLNSIFESSSSLYYFVFKNLYFFNIILILLSSFLVFTCKNSNEIKIKNLYNFKSLVMVLTIAIIGILSIKKDLPFLYFQF
ncbi:MAG: membrane-bound O-acyltransferase family protein [Alphaproteobacteria bacterium]|nr:membrane-bound O-acyltransferase family protein [Alphaproteobacteria bacterium]